jgi:hypothetical protein
MTRSDISYVVQHVSQFMGSPSYVHFEAVKWILRYLKGTLGVGLPICRSPNCSFLVAYSDATSFLGVPRSSPPFLVPVPKQNIAPLHMPVSILCGFKVS